MQSADMTAIAAALAGTPPKCIDSRQKPDDAYAAALAYEAALSKYGLSTLYAVEVRYVSSSNWGIYISVIVPDLDTSLA